MTLSKTKVLVIFVLPVLLFGCATRATNRYSPRTENIMKLRNLNDQKVTVGDFNSKAETPSASGDKSSMMCRAAGPIKTPNGRPYYVYIKDAFVDELQMAKVYKSDAEVKITGTVNRVNFSSTSGEWYLGWTLKSSNGKSLSVSNTSSFTTSFNAAVACDEAAKAFSPAVQDLVAKTVNHPKFKTLLKPSTE